MKKYFQLILPIFICCTILYGNEGGTEGNNPLMAADTADQTSLSGGNGGSGIFDGRKPTAAVYSLIIPGSGQTLLGSPYKGFGFTFVAFGSALTTMISHNNFVASNERLDALEFQYKSSTMWETSNQLYTSMRETHDKLVRYKKMRNTFAIVSAIVWTLNIADVLFNTDDEGEIIFSSITVTNSPFVFAGGMIDQQQRLNFSIPLD